MRREWKTYNLGDFADINPRVPLKQGNEYSFVEMKDLDANLKYVTPSVIKELKGGSKFQNGDTLFARITPCLENGKICQVKNLEDGVGFGSTEFMVFRGKENLSNTDFIYYLTRTDYVRNNAIQLMTGTSGRQRVERSSLQELEVIAPDLPTQQSIAAILSSLDNKIEINLQMNQTLESMAQTIYKDWFVNFTFPEFDGKLINGLPKGWRIGKISDIYRTTSGGTPSRTKEEYFQNGTIKWVKSKELNGGFIFDTEEKITEDAVKNSSAKKIPRHSLLIAMYGATVGEYAVISSEATCNQAICAIIPNDEYPFTYILEYLKINKDNIIGQASGSAQQNISQALIQRQEILIPPSEIVKEFHEVVGCLFEKVENNLLANLNLIEIRDSLLSKLMTGQIEIEE